MKLIPIWVRDEDTPLWMRVGWWISLSVTLAAWVFAAVTILAS